MRWGQWDRAGGRGPVRSVAWRPRIRWSHAEEATRRCPQPPRPPRYHRPRRSRPCNRAAACRPAAVAPRRRRQPSHTAPRQCRRGQLPLPKPAVLSGGSLASRCDKGACAGAANPIAPRRLPPLRPLPGGRPPRRLAPSGAAWWMAVARLRRPPPQKIRLCTGAGSGGQRTGNGVGRQVQLGEASGHARRGVDGGRQGQRRVYS